MHRLAMWCVGVGVAVASTGCSATQATDDAATDDAGSDGMIVDASAPDPDTGNVCDVDGDGEPATACGGRDCDDAHANINPGEVETCDVAGVDEDCDPSTYGFRDVDGDGYGDGTCCNGSTCGRDCDDTAGGVHPGVPDTCNLIDDDCDGAIDEFATVMLYRDTDGDTFGDVNDSVTGCVGFVPGYVLDGTDCDDSRTATHPGATEMCNGIDDDCALPVDPVSCACTDGEVLPCGYSTGATDRCAIVMGTCRSGALDCPPGLITGLEVELCNGLDDNCDGVVDLGLTPPSSPGLPIGQCYDGATGTAGVGVCHVGTWSCTGTGGWACNGQVMPSSGPECGVDLNCNGATYEGVACRPGDARSSTLCSASAIRCDQTCDATCTWPSTCTMTPSLFHFYASTDTQLDCGTVCPAGGVPGVCGGSSCFPGYPRTFLATPSMNFPPGTYTVELFMGGNSGGVWQAVAAAVGGVTVYGTSGERTFDPSGALHSETFSFELPASMFSIPACNPGVYIAVQGIRNGTFMRVTDVTIASSAPTRTWPG